jgi:flagellar biogenesis protein FliO
MFEADTRELGRAAAAGFGTAIGLSFLAGFIVVLFQIPFFGIIIVGAIGWVVGEVVYRASGQKQSRYLQWIAGLSVLSSFLVLTIFGDFTAILGLIIGTYYAIQRVKPPRGVQ